MDSSKIQFGRVAFPEPKSSFNVASIIKICLFHWPLLLIGLALSATAAYFYLSYIQPVYKIKATIQVQDIQRSAEAKSALHEIDLSRSPKIIENEIELLKSNQLVSQVIKDLGLNTTYQWKEGFFYRDLYGSSPIEIHQHAEYIQPGQLEIKVISNKAFSIQYEDGAVKNYSFGQKFKYNGIEYSIVANDWINKFVGLELKVSQANVEDWSLYYQSAIEVEAANVLSSTILISINDPIASRGKDILNRLITNYQLVSNSEQTKSFNTTLDFLQQRISALQGELTDAEQSISNFKSSRGLTDLSSDSKVSLQNMQTNDMHLNQVNVQLSVIEGIERYMNTASNSEKIPVTLGIVDPTLTNLIDKLSQLQLQRERLLATTPETNPDFEPLNRQILLTRNSIRENIGSTKASLFNTRQKLQSYNSKFEYAIKKVPVQEQQFVTIKRQQAIKENMYNYLLQKKEEVSMNYASTLAKSQVIDYAYAEPARKTSSLKVFALAILIGLLIPGGLVVLKNSFTSKVMNSQDVSSILDIPIVAEIAQNHTSQSIVIGGHNTNETAEQFRALRTRIARIYGENRSGRVTMVTSSISGEGKSFISTNLATSLAAIGRKTLLLELDLRKPQAKTLMSLPSEFPGITDVLTGEVRLADAIQETPFSPFLRVITSGGFVQNPSELLEDESLHQLVRELREEYDDIVIDSPPVHIVSDALILAPLADLTLYAIRQGYTPQSELNFLKDLCKQEQLGTIRLVFNGIQRLRYGYGAQFDYSYAGSAPHSAVYEAVFKDFKSRF
jgi:tyrosine-protein kinase Etk/Wzc